MVQANWQTGDRVLAEWQLDHYWYPATVQACERDGVRVDYDDGDRAVVPFNKLEALRVGVGTRVYARWRAGPYYSPGHVERQDGSRILIRYDNGRLENSSLSVVRRGGIATLSFWLPCPRNAWA